MDGMKNLQMQKIEAENVCMDAVNKFQMQIIDEANFAFIEMK